VAVKAWLLKGAQDEEADDVPDDIDSEISEEELLDEELPDTPGAGEMPVAYEWVNRLPLRQAAQAFWSDRLQVHPPVGRLQPLGNITIPTSVHKVNRVRGSPAMPSMAAGRSNLCPLPAHLPSALLWVAAFAADVR
jgi:hypothetical protein